MPLTVNVVCVCVWVYVFTQAQVLISTVLPHNYFDEDELDVFVLLFCLSHSFRFSRPGKTLHHWHGEIDDDG